MRGRNPLDRLTTLLQHRALSTKIDSTLQKRSLQFPSTDELYDLWPVLISQQRVMHTLSFFDPSCNHKTTLKNLTQGRRIQKNLFEIWYFLHHDPIFIMEIGTRTGMSLVNKLAFHGRPEDCVVLCFDLFVEGGSPQFVKNNLQYMGIPSDNVYFVVGDSRITVPAALSRIKDFRQFDYILVDGAHDADTAYEDLKNVLPFVKAGGCIVFDDAGPDELGEGHDLIRVWNALFEKHKHQFDCYYYNLPYGFCVAKRR